MRVPAVWDVLRSDDSTTIVVKPDTTVIDALRILVQEEFGGQELFAIDNPVLVEEAKSLRVEAWRAYSPAQAEAENIDADDYSEWWGPDGAGADTIYVVCVERDVMDLGDEAEACA